MYKRRVLRTRSEEWRHTISGTVSFLVSEVLFEACGGCRIGPSAVRKTCCYYIELASFRCSCWCATDMVAPSRMTQPLFFALCLERFSPLVPPCPPRIPILFFSTRRWKCLLARATCASLPRRDRTDRTMFCHLSVLKTKDSGLRRKKPVVSSAWDAAALD